MNLAQAMPPQAVVADCSNLHVARKVWFFDTSRRVNPNLRFDYNASETSIPISVRSRIYAFY